MNVLVLLAGVADPKWPLPAAFDAAALLAHRTAHPALSPFDEAALELALKWRDAQPDTRVTALVGATGPQDALLRQVAGFRLDAIEGLDLAAHPAWDAAGLAARLAAWVRSREAMPELVLLGREFGDEDDGCVPGLLAEALGLSMQSQVLGLQPGAAGATLVCQSEGGLERRHCALPLLAAVTNHAGNRLRHPLMKNVMQARKASFSMAALPATPEAASTRRLALQAAQAPTRAADCEMLQGDVAAQAAALAQRLIAEARG